MVSLVGYTNAGKSTLFNALTGAGVLAKDMLFATLDPTLRRIEFPEGNAFILSDTVGFISELPTQLIAAFRATLEEILEADLIVHVRDIAAESSEAERAEVEKVLTEIGIGPEEQRNRVVEVWNKADLLPEEERASLSRRAKGAVPSAVLISAATGEGMAELMGLIRSKLATNMRTRNVIVEDGDGALIHWLYENTEVLNRRSLDDGSSEFEVRFACEREHDLDRHLRRGAA